MLHRTPAMRPASPGSRRLIGVRLEFSAGANWGQTRISGVPPAALMGTALVILYLVLLAIVHDGTKGESRINRADVLVALSAAAGGGSWGLVVAYGGIGLPSYFPSPLVVHAIVSSALLFGILKLGRLTFSGKAQPVAYLSAMRHLRKR